MNEDELEIGALRYIAEQTAKEQGCPYENYPKLELPFCDWDEGCQPEETFGEDEAAIRCWIKLWKMNAEQANTGGK